MFDEPTYIVLDIPEPVSEIIRNIRKRHDSERAILPVEITVAGSSGIGTIAGGQDEAEVFRMIDETAKKFGPFTASFQRIKKFPRTDIFYFEISEPEKIMAIHQALAVSGVKFNESPFPFTPHCTLKLVGEVTKREAHELISVVPPQNEFLIDMLSVYMHEELESKLLHRSKLGCKN
jgi:2'-5' RNA ligase